MQRIRQHKIHRKFAIEILLAQSIRNPSCSRYGRDWGGKSVEKGAMNKEQSDNLAVR